MEALISLSQLYPPFFYGLVFLVSLMVGSFLNVVIHRLPIMMENSWKQEYSAYFTRENEHVNDEILVHEPNDSEPYNLIKPDSTCPVCGHKIRPWENIPIVSYLWLKGKCASCKTPISLRYPCVELFTALTSTFAAFYFGPSSQALWAIVLTYFLVAMLFIDLDKMLLPDQLTLPLLWLGLLLSTQSVFVDMQSAIWGAAIGYLSLWLVYWMFKIATGKEGMGYGDFKLLAALGAFVGWQGLPIIILFSSLVGAMAGVAIMVFKNKGKSLAIPFGPYLAVAGWITLLFKPQIAQAYINWVLG